MYNLSRKIYNFEYVPWIHNYVFSINRRISMQSLDGSISLILFLDDNARLAGIILHDDEQVKNKLLYETMRRAS